MSAPTTPFPSEHLEDFTKLAWCNALLSDPSISQLHKREVPSESAAARNISNTYFAQTLFTDSAIRAWLYLYRQNPTSAPSQPSNPDNLSPHEKAHLQDATTRASTPSPPPPPPGPETLILASLGKGIESGVNIVHGGVTAALLDQAMGRLIWYLHGTFPATAEMTVKYKRPVPTPSVVLARARVEKDEGRFVRTVAWVEDGWGKVLAEGRAKFLKSVGGPPKARL